MNMLSINISLSRPGFSFEVNEVFNTGITGIFGHSGAGKTTLLQCISGVVTPEIGTIISRERILFSSEKKINVATHKRHVGYVFQDGRLFPHLTVRKNLQYGIRFLKNRKNKTSFEGVVEMLEIENLLDKYPSEISGGERQRVALGRALLAAPEVLLLDEPFSALDQKLRQQIIPFIAKVAKRLEIPVLLVSHDLPDILKLTNRLCLIRDGKVSGHGFYDQLLEDNSLFKIFPAAETINTMTLEVKHIHSEEGIIRLNGLGDNKMVNILFEPKLKKYAPGDQIKVFLRPNDIVLATEQIASTSFQNQLRGKVKHLSEDGPVVLCLVDCGVLFIVEVSKASARRMKLKKGMEVYCLFKSLALDSIQV